MIDLDRKRIPGRTKYLTIPLGIIVLAGIIYGGYKLLTRNDLESAITEFDDKNYVAAIVRLNKLAVVLDYDKGEKVYYYRVRSLNRLAAELEDDYSDELARASLDKKGTPDYDKTLKKINGKLEKINRKTAGDLVVVPMRKKSRIVSRGRFYDDFFSRYKGSSLIEDLDYEELQKSEKTDPDRILTALVFFYNKYPNTNYISALVKTLFDSLNTGKLNMADKEKVLWEMIISYGKKFPTSPEINKIMVSKNEGVNLRNSPGLEGNLVGKIAKDQILIQLEKSMDTSQVGDVRDYWYRVSDLKGVRGWIFGKFLKPIDITQYQNDETTDKWSLEEYFTEWDDSNTPKNWQHVPESEKSCISFSGTGKRKVIVINAKKGVVTGLFTRYNASRAFSILSRARMVKGESYTAFAYALGNGKSFILKLKDDEIDISGRKIPVRTGDWHDYMLASDDGVHAKLTIDGELVASRIPAVDNRDFSLRGLYCLSASRDDAGVGEMEYIKVR